MSGLSRSSHALVTGGGRGIGRAIAASLVGAGATVTVLGRNAATLGEAVSAGAAHYAAVADVSDEAALKAVIAAAHAACFSMALSSILAKAGNPPDSVHTDATVTLRPVDGQPTITKISLVTVGRVPGIDAATFTELQLMNWDHVAGLGMLSLGATDRAAPKGDAAGPCPS